MRVRETARRTNRVAPNPSISSGGGDPQDLVRAAEWGARLHLAAGGDAEVVSTDLNPLVVGELRAADPECTHRPDLWALRRAERRSDRGLDDASVRARDPQRQALRAGAADDKGNFFPLLYVACELAQNDELPVNVRILVEGEEEVGGDSVGDWVMADERGADVAIVFDSGMLDEATPRYLGVRGMVSMSVDVRTGRGNLHSGLYGGTVLNATHVLQQMLATSAGSGRQAARRTAGGSRRARRGRAQGMGAIAQRRGVVRASRRHADR